MTTPDTGAVVRLVLYMRTQRLRGRSTLPGSQRWFAAGEDLVPGSGDLKAWVLTALTQHPQKLLARELHPPHPSHPACCCPRMMLTSLPCSATFRGSPATTEKKKTQTLCTGLSISDFRHHTCNPFTPHKLSAGVRRDWITHLPQQASCTHRRASVSCPSVWKLFSPHAPWHACPSSWERPAVCPRQCSPPPPHPVSSLLHTSHCWQGIPRHRCTVSV